MDLKIRDLTIERFRSLRSLQIGPIGRVNLITGRNNTGKSSVLEAIRILASGGSPTVMLNILRLREEFNERDESVLTEDPDTLFPMSSLFFGFPKFSTLLDPIVIEATGGTSRLRKSIRVGWCTTDRSPDGFASLVESQPDFFGEQETQPALLINGDGPTRILPLGSLRNARWRVLREFAEASQLPCRYVSPFGGESTAALGILWDTIALSDYETDVVSALQLIEPDIIAVSMVGGESPRRTRTAIVKSNSIRKPVPLRSFGDGLNRLFGIMLHLVNAAGGLLLIDEFENGLHHTIQTDAWRVVFKLARKLDIQVVATSHSWDAIEAFQHAAAEDEESEGVLIRLTRKGDEVIPTMFREDELAIATRDHIEVR